MSSFWPTESQARIDQPDPCTPLATAVKCARKESKEPKRSSMAAARARP
jgi:hypothetical protein